MPVAVDGYLVVALVLWMSPVPAKVAEFARTNTYFAAGIGIAAQSAYHTLQTWSTDGVVWRAVMAAVVGSLPPAVAALAVHMRALIRRESGKPEAPEAPRTPEPEPTRQPVPAAAVPPVHPTVAAPPSVPLPQPAPVALVPQPASDEVPDWMVAELATLESPVFVSPESEAPEPPKAVFLQPERNGALRYPTTGYPMVPETAVNIPYLEVPVGRRTAEMTWAMYDAVVKAWPGLNQVEQAAKMGISDRMLRQAIKARADAQAAAA